MNKCLVCLSGGDLFININSLEWEELHVKYLIEKYLWPMEYNNMVTSGVCNTCWQELFGFHKFYQDVQETQYKLGHSSTLNDDTHQKSKDVKHENLFIDFKNAKVNNENDIQQHSKEFVIEEIITDIKPQCTKELDPLNELESNNQPDANEKKFSTNLEIREIETNSYQSDFTNNFSDKESLGNNENTTESKKKEYKIDEKDKFIAEHFKISCCLCKTTMKTFHDMCQHFKLQHKIRGYVTCCNKKIFRRCYLLDHINFHSNPNYFKCTQCNKVLADRLCLKSHLKTHLENVEKNYCCDICGKSFIIQSQLKIHKSTHLTEEEKQFSCSACEKKFANKYLLSNHVHAVHLKVNYKICDICGKSLCSAEYFERHMLEHKGKSAPTFNCDICGLVLTSMKGLKRHKKSIHPTGGHQEYTCTICSKVSPNINAHKWHIKFSHIMGYNHKCNICDKAFKKPRTLKEHMATHTGTVLYTCSWCPKTFNSNANIYSHRKKIHPVEWLEMTRKKYSGKLPPKK